MLLNILGCRYVLRCEHLVQLSFVILTSELKQELMSKCAMLQCVGAVQRGVPNSEADLYRALCA